MPEETEAAQPGERDGQGREHLETSTAKFSDRIIQRHIKHRECCFGAYKKQEIQKHPQDVHAHGSRTTKVPNEANRHHEYCNPREHCTYTLTGNTNRNLQKSELNMEKEMEKVTYLRIIKLPASTAHKKLKEQSFNCSFSKAIATRIKSSSSNRNLVAKIIFLSKGIFKRKKKCKLIGLFLSTLGGRPTDSNISFNNFYSPLSSSSSSINLTTNEAYQKDCIKCKANYPSSKLKLKPAIKHFLNFIHYQVLSQNKRNALYQCQLVPLNIRFRFKYDDFNSQKRIKKSQTQQQSEKLNTSSVCVTPVFTGQILNNKELFQALDFVENNKNPTPYNVYQYMVTLDDYVIQHRYRHSKINYRRSLPRLSLKQNRKGLTNRIYKYKFSQRHTLTYFVEIDYKNPALELSQASRQAVGIGSTCDFSIDFGRSTISDVSVYGRSNPHLDQKGIFRSKTHITKIQSRSKRDQKDTVALYTSSGMERRALQSFGCSPGACVPRKCEPKECIKRIKNNNPYGSHASTQSRKYKMQNQIAVKETKNRNTSSRIIKHKQKSTKKGRGNKHGANIASPSRGIPHRGVTRIGSKCSFNVQFSKDTPRSSQLINSKKNENKKRVNKRQFACMTGDCVPGKCEPSECYQRLKVTHVGTASSIGSSHSSQVSTQSHKIKARELKAGKETFYKERGVSSISRRKQTLQIPDRQAVRIGSTCSFNVEFYKSTLQNDAVNFARKSKPQLSSKVKPRSDKKKKQSADKATKQRVACQSGTCTRSKCDPSECFQRFASTYKVAGSNVCLTSSSNAASHSSQTSTKARKKEEQKLKLGKIISFKDKGTSSMPKPKVSLHVPDRQVVRIGSKCSFNIEFYKSTAQNGFVINEQNQPTKISMNKSKSHGKYEQGDTPIHNKAGIEKKRFQCEPAICVPGKCDPKECLSRLKTRNSAVGIGTSANSNTTSHGSQTSTKAGKNQQRELKAGKSTFYKNKGVSSKPRPKVPLHVPDRQVVRIGSKCSFNVEFYKSLAPNGFVINEQSRPSNMSTNKAKSHGKYEQGDTPMLNKAGTEKKRFQCEPAICVPGKCDPQECFSRLKTRNSTVGIGTSANSNTTSHGSQTSTKAGKNQQRELKAGKSTFNKDKSASIMPKSKLPLGKINVEGPIRQAVCIGSKCSFNVEFYKSTPQNNFVGQNRPSKTSMKKAKSHGKYEQGDTLMLNKVDAGKKRLECEPGICVPSKCDPKECFLRLKTRHSAVGTDTSLIASSNTTSHGSQASTKTAKGKRRELKAGKTTFYKDKGASSMPRPKVSLHVPDRQVVRIGSKCSFNVEFYKSLAPNGFVIDEQNRPSNISTNKVKSHGKYEQGDTPMLNKAGTEKKRFQCEPAICVPGKCDPKECLSRLKTRNSAVGIGTSGNSNTTSHGSQASTKAGKTKQRELNAAKTTFYKDKGASIMPKSKLPLGKINVEGPIRQAVRIGSKCSFNVEFYKSTPQNSFVGQNRPSKTSMKKAKSHGKYEQGDTLMLNKVDAGKKRLECEPGICVPSKCDPKECFLRLKTRHSAVGTGTSLIASSNTTSHGSQASTKTAKGKRRELKAGKTTFYKDKGASSMPRPKVSLHVPDRQVVRIGSKCSFNIEFYKSTAQNGFVTNEQNQPTKISMNKLKSHGKYEQGDTPILNKAGIEKKRFQCEPAICVPGKCDPKECLSRLKTRNSAVGIGTSANSNTTSHGSQTFTKAGKTKRQELNAAKTTFYKDKGASSMPRPKVPLHVPNRQVVRIGSKCSFNVEFYKSMAQNGFEQIYGKYQEQGDTYTLNKMSTRKERFQCEPGICVPGKCDANECFLRLKPRNSAVPLISTSANSNTTSHGSQASSKIGKNKGRQVKSGKTMFYKDKGDSSIRYKISGPKVPLQMPNRPAVRIGSTCSFNVEFYKDVPQKGLIYNEQNQSAQISADEENLRKVKTRKKVKGLGCEPRVCHPDNCDPSECFQRLKTTYMAAGTDSSLMTASSATTHGIQTFYKTGVKKRRLTKGGRANFYKDTGISSIAMPKIAMQKLLESNRQVVRIGSTYSFNIEFYKDAPQKGLLFNEQHLPAQISAGEENLHTVKSRKKVHALKRLECNPGVCTPGNCDPSECFQRLKRTYKAAGTDSSLMTGSSATTHGNQTLSKLREKKRRVIKGGKASFYKDTGVSSIAKPKIAMERLLEPNRQVVRIGSTCSFNIEFYKDAPHKGLLFNELYQPAQISAGENSLHKVRTKKKVHALKRLECEPGVCHFSKCDPSECFQRLKTTYRATGTDSSLMTDSSATTHGIQTSSKPREKKRRLIKTGKAGFYKDTGVSSMAKPKIAIEKLLEPKRQVVRIGSTCSFNIEFYKSLPQNHLYSNLNTQPVETFKKINRKSNKKGASTSNNNKALKETTKQSPAHFDTAKHRKNKKNKIRAIKPYECEPGDCVIQKCDPSECYARLKNRHGGVSTDAVLSQNSKVSTQTKKKKKESRQKRAGKETVYKEKGALTLPRQKMPLHIHNRQVVRIGSKCSFNVEFYKDMSQNRLRESNTNLSRNRHFPGQYYDASLKKNNMALRQIECDRGVCVPGKCDPRDCYQRLKSRNVGADSEYEAASTDKDQSIIDPSRPLTAGNRNKKLKKKLNQNIKTLDQYDQGDAAVKQADTKKKTKQSIKKAKQIKQSPGQHDQGDKRFEGKDEGSNADASLPSTKSTVSHFSSDVSTHSKKAGGQKPNKQAVHIGSTHSVNVQDMRRHPTPADQHITIPSKPLELKKKKGITSLLKKCCRTFSKKRPIQKIQSPIQPSQAPDTNQENTTRKKRKNSSQKQTVQLPELEQSTRSKESNSKLQPTNPENVYPIEAGRPPNVQSTAVSHGNDAATQSRRYPGQEQRIRQEKVFKTNICKCGEKIRPSFAKRLRQVTEHMLRAEKRKKRKGEGHCCCMHLVSNTGYGDNLPRDLKEQAVVIGSTCGFNFKYLKKR